MLPRTLWWRAFLARRRLSEFRSRRLTALQACPARNQPPLASPFATSATKLRDPDSGASSNIAEALLRTRPDISESRRDDPQSSQNGTGKRRSFVQSVRASRKVGVLSRGGFLSDGSLPLGTEFQNLLPRIDDKSKAEALDDRRSLQAWLAEPDPTNPTFQMARSAEKILERLEDPESDTQPSAAMCAAAVQVLLYYRLKHSPKCGRWALQTLRKICRMDPLWSPESGVLHEIIWACRYRQNYQTAMSLLKLLRSRSFADEHLTPLLEVCTFLLHSPTRLDRRRVLSTLKIVFACFGGLEAQHPRLLSGLLISICQASKEAAASEEAWRLATALMEALERHLAAHAYSDEMSRSQAMAWGAIALCQAHAHGSSGHARSTDFFSSSSLRAAASAGGSRLANQNSFWPRQFEAHAQEALQDSEVRHEVEAVLVSYHLQSSDLEQEGQVGAALDNAAEALGTPRGRHGLSTLTWVCAMRELLENSLPPVISTQSRKGQRYVPPHLGDQEVQGDPSQVQPQPNPLRNHEAEALFQSYLTADENQRFRFRQPSPELVIPLVKVLLDNFPPSLQSAMRLYALAHPNAMSSRVKRNASHQSRFLSRILRKGEDTESSSTRSSELNADLVTVMLERLLGDHKVPSAQEHRAATAIISDVIDSVHPGDWLPRAERSRWTLNWFRYSSDKEDFRELMKMWQSMRQQKPAQQSDQAASASSSWLGDFGKREWFAILTTLSGSAVGFEPLTAETTQSRDDPAPFPFPLPLLTTAAADCVEHGWTLGRETYSHLFYRLGKFATMRYRNRTPTSAPSQKVIHQAIFSLHTLLTREDREMTPDIGVLNALMNAYNRVGDMQRVLDVWEAVAMIAMRDHTRRKEETTSSSSSGKSASKAHGGPSERIIDGGTIAVLLDACGFHNETEVAERAWKFVGRLDSSIDERLAAQGLPPQPLRLRIRNLNAWLSWLEFLCRRGRLAEACSKGLDDMRASGWQPTARVLQTLLKFAAFEDRDAAGQVGPSVWTQLRDRILAGEFRETTGDPRQFWDQVRRAGSSAHSGRAAAEDEKWS
ncbi:unnamed protein product [Jaminaea pallidilutea]